MKPTLVRFAQLVIAASLGLTPLAYAKDGINDFKTRPDGDTPWELVQHLEMFKYDKAPSDPRAECQKHPSGGHMFNWTWLGGSTVTAVGAFAPPISDSLKKQNYILLCNYDPDNFGFDLSRYEVEMKNCHVYICDAHFRIHRLSRENLYLTYTIKAGVEGFAKIHFKDSEGHTYKCYNGKCKALDQTVG
ncbi:MAG: hypothetical protein VYC38_07460 [Pseudomonadota bacterium]|nr:hypothetical protein [Pseudomonadota bacterium]